MARRVHHISRNRPEREFLLVPEELVELAAVALELGPGIDHLAEGLLDDGDALADRELAADLRLDVGSGRQVVGMDMGLEQPLAGEPVLADMGDDLVGRASARPP